MSDKAMPKEVCDYCGRSIEDGYEVVNYNGKIGRLHSECVDALQSQGINNPFELAARNADWAQVVQNGGPPCFHFEADLAKFCLRAKRWPGHAEGEWPSHKFVPLEELLRIVAAECTAPAPQPDIRQHIANKLIRRAEYNERSFGANAMLTEELRRLAKEILDDAAATPQVTPALSSDDRPCQDCGQVNPVWFADNEVWNTVFPERVGYVCPNCFIKRADSVVTNTGWKLVPEISPAPTSIASGMVWYQDNVLKQTHKLEGTSEQAPQELELEEEADGRWLAAYTRFPGVAAYGPSREEAIRNAAKVLIEDGEVERG